MSKNILQTKKLLLFFVMLAIMFMVSHCSPSQKFNSSLLSKLGKVAVISYGEYQLIYIPSPSKKITGDEEETIKELEGFLERFPLAKILRQKFSKALKDYHSQIDLVSEAILEETENVSLTNCLSWARANHIDTIIILESTLEVSHAYRTRDVPLRYYPKIWTKAKIIRIHDDKMLWTNRVWTHAMDGTASGLPSYSAYDTVFDRNSLETLIDRKLDFVVKNLMKDFD